MISVVLAMLHPHQRVAIGAPHRPGIERAQVALRPDPFAPAALTPCERSAEMRRNVHQDVRVLALSLARFPHPNVSEWGALGAKPIGSQLHVPAERSHRIGNGCRFEMNGCVAIKGSANLNRELSASHDVADLMECERSRAATSPKLPYFTVARQRSSVAPSNISLYFIGGLDCLSVAASARCRRTQDSIFNCTARARLPGLRL